MTGDRLNGHSNYGRRFDNRDDAELEALIGRMRACRLCVERPSGRPLPHAPRPVFQVSPHAPVALCGQAPGARVHASGRPYTDPSGARLRSWLNVDETTFYDAQRFAMVPMGFCFPGLDAKGGDLPPRRECRGIWHDKLFATLPAVRLVIAIGVYAQSYHLPNRRGGLTRTVAEWREIWNTTLESGGLAVLPLPHPSWRNNAWLKRHPWFVSEVVPHLRTAVAAALQGAPLPKV